MCLSFVKVYRIDLMSQWFRVLIFWLITKMENNRDGILSAVGSTQQKMDNSLSLNAAETLWVLLVNNIDTFVFLSDCYYMITILHHLLIYTSMKTFSTPNL